MSITRPFRQTWQLFERLSPFFIAVFSDMGLYTPEGRQLIRGKIRRSFLSLVPPLSRALQRHYGLTGGCVSCGASCNLMFQCPQWNTTTRLCSIYEDRPSVCKLFPITPKDISDRNIVLKDKPCGFAFTKNSRRK